MTKHQVNSSTITVPVCNRKRSWIALCSCIPFASSFPHISFQSHHRSSTISSLHASAKTTSTSSSSFYKGGQPPRIQTLTQPIQRVLCLSDLHADHKDNLQWVQEHFGSNNDLFGPHDLIVVAGDISHDLDRLAVTLEYLQQGGASVHFVPGNHEAWLTATKETTTTTTTTTTSLDKLEQVYEVCRQQGVYTDALYIPTAQTQHDCWIVPLQSWYDATLSIQGCEDLCRDFGKWPWVDFLRCDWGPDFADMGPPNKRIPDGLTEFLLSLNEPLLNQVSQRILLDKDVHDDDDDDASNSKTTTVMTVSYFLPNQKCLPDWKDVESDTFLRKSWLNHGGGGVSAKFAKVAGTELLDDQIREFYDGLMEHKPIVRPIHNFGHSHRPKDFELDGIRYIHNPLGKPRERDIYMVSPNVTCLEVWNAEAGHVPGKTVIRLWEEEGGGVEALQTRMKQSKRKSRYAKGYKEVSSGGASRGK